jgi:chromosome segregation ATPase
MPVAAEYCDEHKAIKSELRGVKTDIRRVEKRVSSHGNEIDELKDIITRLTVLQETSEKTQKDFREAIDNLNATVQTIRDAPSARWSHLVTAATTICVTLIFTYFFNAMIG